MKNKSILIFGAGLNQLKLLEASRRLGIKSIVLDPNPDASGKEATDFFYVVDGDDYEMTKQIALKHRVNGLATTQTEKPMRLMAKLAQDIGLQFHTPEVVERSLDKWLMKQAFLYHKVACANGVIFQKEHTINIASLRGLTFPVVMKPKDATSSQGVYKIDNIDQIEQFQTITSRFSKNGEIIIEEFLEGPEYSIESITFRGETTIIQYTEKFITPFPYTVEMGHLQPADLTTEQKTAIDIVVKKAIKAIGIDNSAAHTEVKLTPDGPKIVEIGARGGGDYISSYLTLASTGISMDEAMIKMALDEKPHLNPSNELYAYIKYFPLPAGYRVHHVADYSDILLEKDVVFAHIAVQEGDTIGEITESKKRPGFVIVQSSDRQSVIERAEVLTDYLVSKIEVN